jgi:hypothetical protein
MNIKVTFLAMLISSNAYASLFGPSVFIEPFLGYKSENIKLTDLTNTVTQIKTASPSLGLKLGYRSMVGVDINLYGETTSGAAEISGLSENSRFSHNTAGVQLGVNGLGLVKMYLGSSFVNDFKLEDSSVLPGYTLSGPSYHAGVQFKFHPRFSLGAQYTLNQFNTIKGTAYAAGENLETYYSKNDTQDYTIYFSTSF